MRRLNPEEFRILRDIYTARLAVLREKIYEVLTESYTGTKSDLEVLEELNDIDLEAQGIIDCGTVLYYLRRER